MSTLIPDILFFRPTRASCFLSTHLTWATDLSQSWPRPTLKHADFFGLNRVQLCQQKRLKLFKYWWRTNVVKLWSITRFTPGFTTWCGLAWLYQCEGCWQIILRIWAYYRHICRSCEVGSVASLAGGTAPGDTRPQGVTPEWKNVAGFTQNSGQTRSDTLKGPGVTPSRGWHQCEINKKWLD